VYCELNNPDRGCTPGYTCTETTVGGAANPPRVHTCLPTVDDGGVFDAPVEKIWRFMQNPGDHHKHQSMANVKREMEGGNVVLSFEAEGPGGAKTPVKIKSTPLLPVGRMMEYIEGPLAGSRSFL